MNKYDNTESTHPIESLANVLSVAVLAGVCSSHPKAYSNYAKAGEKYRTANADDDHMYTQTYVSY